MAVIAETRSLTKTYIQGMHEIRALDSVDFEVSAGEFVSLVGPSGSGKSTLLHILGGLDEPTSGEVWFEGLNLGEQSVKQKTHLRLHKVGFVFQAYNLLPVLSARENVEFILQLQGVGKKERRERAENTLATLGLSELFDRRPNDMSGGQQQRVAIARALVSNPVLLLADEPSANLDTATTREFCETLSRINSEMGVSIVTATHDPLVMGYAKRQLNLRDGSIENIEDIAA